MTDSSSEINWGGLRVAANGYGVSFWGDGNVLKLITVMDAQLFVNQLQSTELYTFKWVNGIKNYVSILNKAVF